MSISKNFVIKHGLEISTDLILADANTRRVGVGTTAPQYLLHVSGGIGVTNAYVSGIGTFADELNVGLGGTVLTVLGVGNSIGIGTALPQYLLDIRSSVSTGQTALYVQGDVRITGDLSLDDVTLDDATIQDLTVTDTFIVAGLSTFSSNVFINAALNVSGVTTLSSYVDINNSVDVGVDLNVVGISTLGGYVDINNSVDISGAINVVGLTTLGGYVDINDSVDVSNNLNVVGVTTLATADINAGEIDVTRIETGDLSVTGIATIATISVVGAALSSLTVSGISILGITSISQLNVSGIGTITNLSSTDATLTNITGTAGTITNLNSTNGTITNLTGTAGTIGNVVISSGIITATSGIVTYYGDGQYLQNILSGVGVATAGGTVGTGATILDFRGAGISTVTVASGIATIFFEGGGGSGGSGGSNTQIQYNNSGVLGGVTGFTYNGTDLNFTGIITATTFSGTATSTTNIPNLTGDITSVGNATSIATGVIVNADINASAGIVDTKLATIATALKVSNSATTATNANTASAIVARDGSGNFSAGTITANLTGTASNVTTNANLTGHITSVGNATVLGSFTSAQLATALTNETGSGAAVFATSPTLTTPVLGTPSSGTLTNCTFPILNQNTTGSAATLTTGRTIAITGDLSYTSGSFSGAANVTGTGTLATVNANVGSFGDGTSIPTITVNAKGLITGVTTTAVSSGGLTISDDTSTNASRFLTFTSATSGSISAANVTSTKLTFNPSTGVLTVVDLNSTSDINLKENIHTVKNALEIIEQLRGVSFDWKETGRSSYGVIAQELEEVLPELVGDGGVKSVNYNGIIGVLIEAVKELKEEVEELKRTK